MFLAQYLSYDLQEWNTRQDLGLNGQFTLPYSFSPLFQPLMF
jgi:hypothetical protein